MDQAFNMEGALPAQMICPLPACQHDESEVIDSRQQNDIRYRRHRCQKCGHKFATYELTAEKLGQIEQDGSTVIRRKLENIVRLAQAALSNSEGAVFRNQERVVNHTETT